MGNIQCTLTPENHLCLAVHVVKKDSLRKSCRMGDVALSVRTFSVDILEGT